MITHQDKNYKIQEITSIVTTIKAMSEEEDDPFPLFLYYPVKSWLNCIN